MEKAEDEKRLNVEKTLAKLIKYLSMTAGR
jgi:hypothetical protein